MSQLDNSRRKLISGFLLLFLTLATFYPVMPAHAQGGIGLAGTFYQQVFELPQGTEISSPSIYVVVFNHTTDELNVQMVFTAPFGVKVLFDQPKFPLPPGGERKVYVTVRVTNDAVPGKYEITITAEATPSGKQGISLATASAQKASLVVSGEAAQISARVTSPDGTPIKAEVRLSKMVQGNPNELARSETGTLESKLSPGLYNLTAFIAGRKLAEQSVEVKTGEKKDVTLTVKTIYFEFFGIEPNYQADGKTPAFVKVAYTLNNLYQPINNVEVMLKVSRDNKPLEQTSFLSLSRMDMGRNSGSQSFVAKGGWGEGSYSFKLELNIEGKLYSESAEEKFTVATSRPSTPSGVESTESPIIDLSTVELPPIVLVGIGAGMVIIIILILVLLPKRH